MCVETNRTSWSSTATDKNVTRSCIRHCFGKEKKNGVQAINSLQIAIKTAASLRDPISAFIAAAYYVRKAPDSSRINQ
jgi:hypothetical protein